MNWVSFRQLGEDVAAFANMLAEYPAFQDIVAVVGVPRSGCVPAGMLALLRGWHYAGVDHFAATGTFETPGSRLQDVPFPKTGKVLLLDDAVGRGESIGAAAAKIREAKACRSFEIVLGAMYVSRWAVTTNRVDVFFRTVNMPRVFEWNLFGHAGVRKWAFSFESLRTGDRIPAHEVAAVVCDVPDTLQKRTAGALAKAGVKYRELAMPGVEAANWDSEERAKWKGEWCRGNDCELFVEMASDTAMAVAEVSKKPVVCWENKRLYSVKR